MEAQSRGLPAERCLAVLLDGDVVRLFRVGEDRVEELGDVAPNGHGNDIAHGARARQARAGGRAGGGRRPPPRCRRADPDLPVLGGAACDHVHRTAERVAALVRTERIGRILAGGAPDCVAELRRILRARLGGDIETLNLPVGASAAQVHAAAHAHCRAEATSREEQVLGDLIEGIGRGLAALGLAAVVEAVNDHRATVLLVAGARTVPGASCDRCAMLFARPAPTTCPGCGAPVEPVPDLVEALAARMAARGGRVERIGGPAGNAFACHDGVAALLHCAFPGAGLTVPWEETAGV